MANVSKKDASASRVKKREKKNVPVGIAHVLATFNNTRITITDPSGAVVAWSTSGCHGFKGAKKATPYAATITAEDAGKKAMEHGMKTIEVKTHGPGAGREAAIRGLQSAGLVIQTIVDITKVPHNGCRAKKARRV